MIIKSIKLFYLILPLMFTAAGCRNNESTSQRVRITRPTRTEVALGHTLLHLAPNWGVAERLIANGADVNARSNIGQTPLSLAKAKGHTEIIDLLHKHAAKE